MPTPKDMLSQAAAQATAEPKQVLCKDGANEVEVWLQSFGVKYSPMRQVPIERIDTKESHKNQARLEAIVPESVERFATWLRNGATLKPVVGYIKSGKLVLVDGNNRVAAYLKERYEVVPAFILHPDTPGIVIEAMTVAANTMHGHTPDVPWRVKQAEHLVGLGYPVEEACKYAAIKASDLQRYQRLEKATIRARNLKIAEFDTLPATHRLKLGSINSNPVLLQAAHVVIRTKMTGAEVEAFVKEIKAAQSDVLAQSIIERVAKERKIEAAEAEARGKKPRIHSPKSNISTAIGKILAADVGQFARMVFTDMERAEMRRRLDQCGLRIMELQIALDNAVEEEQRNVG